MKKTISTTILIIVLSACSSNAQPASAPVLESAPPAISATMMPPTGTIPQIGEPTNADWFGIPIMPGATAGEGDEEGYVFTIKGTIDQVRKFYEAELPKIGWESLPSEDASTLLFIRDNGAESLTISLITNQDEVLVLLIK